MSKNQHSKRTRRLLAREDQRCIRCGKRLEKCSQCGMRPWFSIHHRLQLKHFKGNGITLPRHKNAKSNTIIVCGADNSDSDSCHHDIELYTDESFSKGFLLRPEQNPEWVPIHTFWGWRLYDNVGNYKAISSLEARRMQSYGPHEQLSKENQVPAQEEDPWSGLIYIP